MPRTITILSMLLALQLVIIGLVYWPQSRPEPQAQSFFAGIRPELVQGMTITDEQGRRLTLDRAAEGWLLTASASPEEPEAEGGTQQGDAGRLLPLPADSAKAGQFVERLLNLHSARLVATTEPSQTRLKVDEKAFVRKIDLRLADAVSTLFLGTSSGPQAMHARAAGDQSVYLLKDLAAWEVSTDPAAWWQSSYLEVEPASLTGLKVRNGHGSVQLAREAGEEWQLTGTAVDTPLDQESLQHLLQQLSFLPVQEYVSREKPAGVGPPEAVLVLRAADRRIDLEVWPAAEEGERLVKSSCSPFWVKVPAYAVQPLLELTPGGLLTGAAS